MNKLNRKVLSRSLSFLFLAFILLLVHPVCTYTQQRPFPSNWPWRGVTVSMLGTNDSDVERLATDIKVNSIQLSLNPRTVAKRHNMSPEKAWEANLDWADKMLDACKSHGIVGIISFSEIPLDPHAGFIQTDPEFWNSAEMLDLTVSLAQTIAKRFAHRGNELAAYEILSEPVDRSNQKIAPGPWRQLLNCCSKSQSISLQAL